MRKMTSVIAAVIAAIIILAGVAVYILYDFGGDDDGKVVYYVVVAPSGMKGALAAGQIDGYIAWEPFVSDSVVEGVGTVVKWSGDIMPNHPCCVVAVYNPFVSTQEGQELATRFLKAHIVATDWINAAMEDEESADYDLLKEIAVEFTMRNESVVKEALEHIEFRHVMDDDFTSALENFTEMYIGLDVIAEEKIADGGYANVTDFVEEYVNESYLGPAESVESSDTILNPDSPIRLGFLQGDLHQLAQAVAKSNAVLGTGNSIFEEYGLNVENAIGAPFANGGAVMDGFAGGYVDIGYLGSPPAILKHLNAEIDTTIIAQVNSEGSAIVVKAGSGIDDLRGLAGKTIANPGESSIQFLLLKIVLQWEGLELRIKT